MDLPHTYCRTSLSCTMITRKSISFAVLVFVPRDAKHEQRRNVAHEVDADHQSPLSGGRALEKPLGVAGKHDADCHEDRDVDRDQDAEQAVPPDPDEIVLKRHHDEKAPEERPVIEGLVGAIVTNSLSARNEMRVKSRIDPTLPVATETTKTSAMTHHARMRALMFSTVARCASTGDSPAQIANRSSTQREAVPGRRPRDREKTCQSRDSSDHSQLNQRCARPRKELVLVFGDVRAQAAGRTRRDSTSGPEAFRLSEGSDSGSRDGPGSTRHPAANGERW